MPLIVTEVLREQRPLAFEEFLRLAGVQNPGTDAVVTVSDVARILKIAPTTLYGWMASGLGPRHFRIKNKIRIRFDDFLNWIEVNTK